MQGQQFSIQNLTTTSSSVAEGSTATLQGDVSNLDGAGFTLTVNWGDGQGPQSYPFPGGPASFSVSHYYGNNGTAFQQTYDIGATVTTSDDRTSGGGTSIQGQNAPPVILGLDAPSGFATSGAGAQLNLFATANDPGASDALSYRWDARQDGNEISEFPVTDASQGGTDTCSLDASSCNHDDITVTLTVQDNDRSTASTSVTLTYDASAPGGNPSSMFQPDQPTVSITETDPGDEDWAGGEANFQVSLTSQLADMPHLGNVTVYYCTYDGTDTVANGDYTPKVGSVTLTYGQLPGTDNYGYAPQGFAVNTAQNAHIGDFSGVIVGTFDPYAAQSWNYIAQRSVAVNVENCDLQLWSDDSTGVYNQVELDGSIGRSGCSTPDLVVAGQVLTLTVTGAPAGATIAFDYPAFPAVVQNFATTSTTGGPVPVGTTITSPNVRTLAFTQGGNGQRVDVQVMWTDPATHTVVERDLSGIFDVDGPKVTATATPSGCPIISHGCIGPTMKFSAGGAPGGWNYEWVQLVVAQTITESTGNKEREFYWNGSATGAAFGLDNRYPAYTGLAGPDWPHTPVDPDVNCKTTFKAKMWLMAQPKGFDPPQEGGGAIFVPLASLQWSYTLDTAGTKVEAFTQSPPGNGTTTTPQIMVPPGEELQTARETQFPMAPETQYPQWHRLSPKPGDPANWTNWKSI